MITVNNDKLEIIRNIEICLKNQINFPIPKFIVRKIINLLISSMNSADAGGKIYSYLMNISKKDIVNNKKSLLKIINIFSEKNLVNALWQSGQEVDYVKLAKEKESLLGELWNDQYEFSKSSKRSLTRILKDGVYVKIETSALRLNIKKLGLRLPLSYHCSELRFLKINTFTNSKLSHLVHDLFDHIYFFSILKRGKFFSFSKAFRGKVGDPMNRDVFSRESELIASVAYERRYYIKNRDIFKLSLNNDHVMSFASKYFGSFTNQYLKKIKFLTKKDISVYHIYYNVLCELSEQMRKVGTIKLITNQGEISGTIIDVLNSDYLKIVIDILYFVTINETLFINRLLDTYVYIEELLHKALNSDHSEYETIINLNSITNYSKSNRIHNKSLKAFFNL